MSEYQIVGASLSDLSRYTTGEPSLSVRVSIGVSIDGESRINIGIPVDMTYDPDATIAQIEETAFGEAVRILAAIKVPTADTLLSLYREPFAETGSGG